MATAMVESQEGVKTLNGGKAEKEELESSSKKIGTSWLKRKKVVKNM
jgi:hypothetical protein